MNRVDRIDQLRNVGVETSYLLDSMIQHFSEDDIKEFYEKFVREHDITFGEEEEECEEEDEEPPRCKYCDDELPYPDWRGGFCGLGCILDEREKNQKKLDS